MCAILDIRCPHVRPPSQTTRTTPMLHRASTTGSNVPVIITTSCGNSCPVAAQGLTLSGPAAGGRGAGALDGANESDTGNGAVLKVAISRPSGLVQAMMMNMVIIIICVAMYYIADETVLIYWIDFSSLVVMGE